MTTLQVVPALPDIKIADPGRGAGMGKDTPSDIQKRNLKGFVQLMLSQTVFKAIGIKGDALKSESEIPQQASALSVPALAGGTGLGSCDL